jgi:hypothetical protein
VTAEGKGVGGGGTATSADTAAVCVLRGFFPFCLFVGRGKKKKKKKIKQKKKIVKRRTPPTTPQHQPAGAGPSGSVPASEPERNLDLLDVVLTTLQDSGINDPVVTADVTGTWVTVTFTVTGITRSTVTALTGIGVGGVFGTSCVAGYSFFTVLLLK